MPSTGKSKEKALLKGREYIGVDKIDGPLIFIRNTHPVGYRELVEFSSIHVLLPEANDKMRDAFGQYPQLTGSVVIPNERNHGVRSSSAASLKQSMCNFIVTCFSTLHRFAANAKNSRKNSSPFFFCS